MESKFKNAVQQLRAGKMIILFDEHREVEADLIMDAKQIKKTDVNFVLTKARGLLCQAITKQHARQLNLEPQTQDNTSLHNTAFTVSVDAAEGCTTGVTAKDRALTMQVVANPNSHPKQLVRPGHVFPIIAHEGGIRMRKGHTEAGIELISQYDAYPSAAICEILDENGNSSNYKRLRKFAQENQLAFYTIEELFKDYEI